MPTVVARTAIYGDKLKCTELFEVWILCLEKLFNYTVNEKSVMLFMFSDLKCGKHEIHLDFHK